MRESQYIEDYLATNANRGLGNGLTVGSFLAYNLRGKAKDYAQVYAQALVNAINRRDCIAAKSAHGGTAYYDINFLTRPELVNIISHDPLTQAALNTISSREELIERMKREIGKPKTAAK